MLLLSYRCNVTVNVLRLFLTVTWVGLQCVIVVFPDHTHLFLANLPYQCHLELEFYSFKGGIGVVSLIDINEPRHEISNNLTF